MGSPTLLTLLFVMAASSLTARAEVCQERAAMGRDGIQWWEGARKMELVTFEGLATWAVSVPDVGLAVCKEDKSELSILDRSSGTFTDISLAPLSDPVGAILFEGKIWVACFGVGTQPGIAVVDPNTKTLEVTYQFPYNADEKPFVHNIYAFDWDGKKEIFVALLGNPWAQLPGMGLVRFDRGSLEFMTNTTDQGMYTRAAAQQADGSVFVIQQNPSGTPTTLAKLEQQGDQFVTVATASLPACDTQCDGADVMIGLEADTLFATDRDQAPGNDGKLYYYTFTDGSFVNRGSWSTGEHPRYTTLIPGSGDIVSCNKADGTITTFPGLALNPLEHLSNNPPGTTLEEAVAEVSFYIQREGFDCAQTWWGGAGSVIAVVAILGALVLVALFCMRAKSNGDPHSGQAQPLQELS